MIEKRLILCYLPTYSPELNLIEILWRKVKYVWLNLMAIMNFDEFKKELNMVFDAVGKEYIISLVSLKVETTGFSRWLFSCLNTYDKPA